MKMTSFEKRLVNSPGHSRSVAEHAVRTLQDVPRRVGESLLDVGCGNGAATLAIGSAHGLIVTGVDIDPEQVRDARALAGPGSGARFEQADATRLPFEDESFDIVATFKTLHHVPEWEAAVAEMIRVLKPEGRLVCADLAVPRWLAAIGRRVGGKHAGFVTRDTLQCLIEAQGLAILRQRSPSLGFELVARRPAGFRHCALTGRASRCRELSAAETAQRGPNGSRGMSSRWWPWMEA